VAPSPTHRRVAGRDGTLETLAKRGVLHVKNHKFQKNIKQSERQSWSYLREEIWPDRKTVAKTMQKPAVLKCAKKNSQIQITVVNFQNKNYLLT